MFNKSFIAGLVGLMAVNIGLFQTGFNEKSAINQTIKVGSTEIEIVVPDVKAPAPKSLDNGIMARVKAVEARAGEIEAANPHGPSANFKAIEARNKSWLENITKKEEAEFEAIKSDYKSRIKETMAHLADPSNFPKQNNIQ